MVNLLRRTAQSATWLLAACTIIWIVGSVTQDRAVVRRAEHPIALRQNDRPVTFLRAIAASHMPG